jgi:hypothetical protein
MLQELGGESGDGSWNTNRSLGLGRGHCLDTHLQRDLGQY